MIRADILENGSILINERTVSDSVKFETIRFSFPCDWECLEKTAVFKNDDTAVFTLSVGDMAAVVITLKGGVFL